MSEPREEEENSEHSEDISGQEGSSGEEEQESALSFEIRDLIPGSWTSATASVTEEEIKGMTVSPSRPLLSMRIAKKRKHFGQIIAKFSGQESQEPLEIPSTRDPNFKKEGYHKTLQIGLQAGCRIKLIPSAKGRSFQAKYFLIQNKSNIYDLKDLIQERETEAESDPTEDPVIEQFVKNVEARIEEALQSNETIDVFHDEFEVLGKEGAEGGGNLANQMVETRTFYNLDFTKNKIVTDVQWEPGVDDVIAASCAESIDFQERIERSGISIPGSIIMWTFAEFNNVKIILKSPIEILCFKFNPYRTNIIVGGTISGQIAMWDTSLVNDKSRIEMLPKQNEAIELHPLVLSGIFDSHKGPVRALCWLPNQVRIERKQHCVVLQEPYETSQIATLSEDGLILFWETQFPPDKNPYKITDFIWLPLLKVQLTRIDNRNDIGGSCLYINPKQSDAKFWATDDSGNLLFGEWLARTMEEGRPEFVKRMYMSDVAYRPAVIMEVSPFFPDIMLTVHDNHFNIWMDGCETPIYQSYFHNSYLTCGAWSPIRPAILFIGRADGRIDIWDFLDQSMKESLFHTVSSQRLTVINFLTIKKTPQLLAAGDVVGNVHIFEVARHNVNDVEREKKTIYDFWSKEHARVEYYEERFKIRAEEHHQAELLKRQAQG